MAPYRRIHIQNVPKSCSYVCSHCDTDGLLGAQFRFLIHAKGKPHAPPAALLLDLQRFSGSFVHPAWDADQGHLMACTLPPTRHQGRFKPL